MTTLDHALSRRRFLQAAGALIVTAAAPSLPFAAVTGDTPRDPLPGELDSWLAIAPSGDVTAFFGKMDMGHGLEIATAQIVAEELDVRVERVTVLMGDTATTCNQGGASGSTGIQQGARPLRNAAAEARRLLLEAAALRLEAPLEALQVEDGIVRVRDAQVTYAELIGGRAFGAPVEWNQKTGNALDVKGRAQPKKPEQYRLVGQPVPRRDVAGKVFGTSEFITDVRVPGMVHARVLRAPTVGAKLGRVDTASIAGIPNVRIVQERELLAVVADDEWSAVRAARELQVEWLPGGSALPGHERLHDYIRQAASGKREEPLKQGDVDAAFAAAARIVEAQYEWPMQSHASMGPACAIVDARADRATLWTGSQKPHATRDGVAKALGLPAERVHGRWFMGAGSYGRNDAGDASLEAAYLSKVVGKPVRVQYMRHEGTAWDPKGPASVTHARAALDAQGRITAYECVVKGLSRSNIAANESDPSHSLLGMALGLPLKPELALGTPADSYEFAAKRYAWEAIGPLAERGSPLRTAHLRDPVGPDIHFGSEQFIDELALAVRQDPVAFRLARVREARDRAVIEAVAQRARWQPRKVPARKRRGGVLSGRGLAYAQRSGTVVAVIAEVEVHPKTGRLWARRFTVAHDCGLIINPQGLTQTIEGNVVQGLSRTLHEEVRFDERAVTSVDWSTYPILEMPDAPEVIDVVLLDRPDAPSSGAGEPTIRCVPAAVANAFFDATGVRLRKAPLTPERVLAALASG